MFAIIIKSDIYTRDVYDQLIAIKFSLKELLEKDGSFSFCDRTIQGIAIEMSKVKYELVPMITANIFCATPENH